MLAINNLNTDVTFGSHPSLKLQKLNSYEL